MMPGFPRSLNAAARALAVGDGLAALGQVGTRTDAPGLLLKGIAYAQIGDLEMAEAALAAATAGARGSPADELLSARAAAARAEIAIEVGQPERARREAARASQMLARRGDARNAAMQRLVVARASVLLGDLDGARRAVDDVLAAPISEDVRAVASLAQAEIAVRSGSAARARDALAGLLLAERPANALLARAARALEAELAAPIARLASGGESRDADLAAIEAAHARGALVVDACRRRVARGERALALASRPVLFALVLELARAFPKDVPRDELAMRAFGARKVNASHRSRLRVEIGRVRQVLRGAFGETQPIATADGYALRSEHDVALVLPLTDDEDARLALLLGDGAAWSAQALAEHAGVSKRTALRALTALVERGKAVKTGSGRDVRYVSAGGRIASRMLLLGLLAAD